MSVASFSRRVSQRLCHSFPSSGRRAGVAEHRLERAVQSVVEALESRTLMAVALPSEPGTYQVNLTVDDDFTADVAGSQYRTLGAAIDYANSTNALGAATPKSTRIFVKNGIYREPLGKTLNKGGDTILTIEGESSTGVIIKGTSVYSSGWTQVAGQPGVWQHDWTPNLLMKGYDEPYGPNKTLNQRTEIMFANGKRLTPVELEKWNISFDWGAYKWKYTYAGWAGFGEMKDYTFGVAELGSSAGDTTGDTNGMLYTGNTADGFETLSEIYNTTGNAHGYANKIFVKLPVGMDPNASTTEVSDQDNNGVKPGTDRLLNIQKSSVVLRNLQFIGFANAGDKSSNAVIHAGYDTYNVAGQVGFQKLRLQNVQVNSNANMGTGFTGIKYLSIENSKFNDNGMNGTSAGRMHESQYIDSSWEGNNWRSDNFGGSYGWASANFKFYISRDQNFLRCNFNNGSSMGLWFDGPNLNNVVEDSWVIGNRDVGIWYEISPGPILFKNNRVEQNWVGLRIANSRNAIVDGGTYLNNNQAQIEIGGLTHDRTNLMYSAGAPFDPDDSILGTTDTPSWVDASYYIRSGNVTIKNATIATGMGSKSRLITMDAKSGEFTSEAEREALLRSEYHASGNTFYYTNAPADKAFQIGDDTYSLSTWASKTGEAGSTTSSSAYNTQPVYIVDNADSTGVTTTGSWSTVTPTDPNSNDYKFMYGPSFLRIWATSPVDASVTFTPNIGVAGEYVVQTNFPQAWNHAYDTPHLVTYNGGSETVKVRQATVGSSSPTPEWRTIGTYNFATGTGGSVRLSTVGVTGGSQIYVIGDVVRWVKKIDTTRAPGSGPGTGVFPALPGAVTSLTATPQSNRVSLSWPAATGSFTGYTIRYGVGASSATKAFNSNAIHVGPGVTSINIDNLTSGQSYTFSVAAEGPAGHGTAATATATPAGSMVERTNAGGTVAGRGDDGANVTANAFDNNASTKWVDTGASWSEWGTYGDQYKGNASWLSYSFAGGNAYVVTQFSVTSSADISSNTSQAPNHYRLLGSNDGGSNWTELFVQKNAAVTTNGTTTTYTIANTQAFKSYRLEVAPTSGSTVQLAEVRFYSPATATGGDTTAPAAVNNTGTSVTQGVTGTVITSSMLKYTDNVSAASAVTYTVTTLPGKGTLKKSGTALALNGTFTQDDLDNSRITYDNTSNSGNDSFAFTVRDAANNAATSATFSITVNKLAAPGSFSLTAGDSKLSVSWAAVSNATGYKIKYGTTSGSYSTTVDVTGGSTTSRDLTPLTNGTTYYVILTAYNAAGEGNATAESSKAPAAVAGASLISTNKSATASSLENTSLVASNVTDGALGTRWSSAYNDNQWIYIDLGSSYNVSRIRLYWETAAGKDYKLQVKADNPGVDTGWTDLKSVTGNTTANSWLDYTGLSGTGRYVRMRGTARATGWGYSLYEFEVYGTAAVAATPAKLTGTVIGTTGSWNNAGNTRDKAFDGDLNTFFDAPTGDGNWVGLDLGSAKTITSIKFAPRSGFASRMSQNGGGYFQVSNSADFSSATTIHTISTTPTVGSLTSVTVSVEGTWRYIRFVSPTGGYGNIAEFEAWGY